MPDRNALQRRIAPGVTLTLEYPDGRKPVTFRLAYNNYAIGHIEEKSGDLNLLQNPFSIWSKFGKRMLGIAFWAALLQDRPELNSEEGLMLAFDYLGGPENELRVFEAVWEAYMLYLPKDQAEQLRADREEWKKKQAEENPPEPAAKIATPAQETIPAGLQVQPSPAQSPQTGSSSGVSPDSTSDSPIAISAS
jgi:hypothetical protein